MNLYKMGLEVIAEKEKMYKSIKLSPTDISYSEFLKHRKAWKSEILAMENEHARQCHLYDNDPLPEVMAWKEGY